MEGQQDRDSYHYDMPSFVAAEIGSEPRVTQKVAEIVVHNGEN